VTKNENENEKISSIENKLLGVKESNALENYQNSSTNNIVQVSNALENYQNSSTNNIVQVSNVLENYQNSNTNNIVQESYLLQKLANNIIQTSQYCKKVIKVTCAKVAVYKAFLIGFFICKLEILSGKLFGTFWAQVHDLLGDLCEPKLSRSWLFEARLLYLRFQRFGRVINDQIHLSNLNLHPILTKKHLNLLIKYCNSEKQENYFIEKTINGSLSAGQLKVDLELSIPSKNEHFIKIGGLPIKHDYCFKTLQIGDLWSENEIKAHIIKNIPQFIGLVLSSEWAFLPGQTIFCGGVRKFPDLCFYNVISHRYLIVDLKVSSFSGDIDRAASQINSYVKSKDACLDLQFQCKTIGLILGKKPINATYFGSLGENSNIFYSSFTV
jgi:hypothetical protein